MADITVTQADIESVARKLDELSDVLNETERAIMLAVFKLAGTALSGRTLGQSSGSRPQTESGSIGGGIGIGGAGSASVATSGRGVSLSSGFKGAFSALGSANIRIAQDFNNAASGVGIGVVC